MLAHVETQTRNATRCREISSGQRLGYFSREHSIILLRHRVLLSYVVIDVDYATFGRFCVATFAERR